MDTLPTLHNIPSFDDQVIIGSVIMIILSVFSLIYMYIDFIILITYQKFIEGGIYLCLILAIAYSHQLFGQTAHIWGFLFACGLTLNTIITQFRIRNELLFLFANVIIHAMTTILFKSYASGLITSFFIMSTISSLICNTISITHDWKYAPIMTAPSIVILIGYYCNFDQFDLPTHLIDNIISISTFILYGIMIMFSSTSQSRNDLYLINNIITIIGSLFIIYLGYVNDNNKNLNLSIAFFISYFLKNIWN